MFNHEPIETRRDGHVENPRRPTACHTKSMRRTARLKKVGASNRFLFLTAPEEGERALQNIDRHIFGVVDVQRRGVIRRAGNLKQIEHAARLFRGRLYTNQRPQ